MAQYVLNLVFGIREGTLDIESKAIMQACRTLDLGVPSDELQNLVLKRALFVDFESGSLEAANTLAKGIASRLEDIRGTSYSSVIHDLHWSLRSKEAPEILAKGEILAETTSFIDGGRTKSPSTS